MGDRDKADSGREAVGDEAVELLPAICRCGAWKSARPSAARDNSDLARTNSASIS